ncbi:MAG: hypothetical protein E7457_02560 [Ruminococcaceae bacterium]|nr:hypothetical protein [Oscillospiraceae bacterium]
MDKWEFDLGNPQEEKPRRVAKHNLKKRWILLGIVAVLAVAAVLVAVLWDPTAFDGLRRGIIYARAEKDESGCAQLYEYAGDKDNNFASLGGSLLTASSGQLSLLGENGAVRYHAGLKFNQAAIVANGDRAVVYDMGGKDLYALDSKGLVWQKTCDGQILSVQINEDGWAAVTLNKSGYKAVVEIYDGKGKLAFAFQSADRFVMTSAVAHNSKQMAAVTLGQADGAFVSSVVIYRLNSEERLAICDLPGSAVYDLGLVEENYCAIAEDGLYFVKQDGTLLDAYSFEGRFLRRCSLQGDGYAALLLGDYKSGSQGRLVTVDEKGQLIAQLEIDREVLSLSAAGRYVAVLYSDSLMIYDREWNVCAQLPDVSVAKQVLMRADGSAVLAGTTAASLYLP